MSLVARHLEAKGLPTLCLGSALDIFQAGKPPRAVFLDYPLGHSAGKPFNRVDQRAVVREALALCGAMHTAGSIEQLPNAWSTEQSWRATTMSASGGDTRMPRDTTPQYQTPEDRRLAEAER